MNRFVPVGSSGRSGLLIDTNLLVLFTVGVVNRGRIENFKRTRQYTERDYNLLLRVFEKTAPLYTVAHVLSEVSNLIDLAGRERLKARHVLKRMLTILQEPQMSSLRAADSRPYEAHGLADAAIAAVALEYNCSVLTDDLDLYLALGREGISVINFTHLRAQEWGI